MKQLNQNIRPIVFIPVQTATASVNGSAVDTKVSEGFTFNTALVLISIGSLGDQTSTTIKIEEADDSNFTGATIAEGGEEITVAANTNYKMEVARKKRYLRAVLTITGGTTPFAVVYVNGILWNAAKPFPII